MRLVDHLNIRAGGPGSGVYIHQKHGPLDLLQTKYRRAHMLQKEHESKRRFHDSRAEALKKSAGPEGGFWSDTATRERGEAHATIADVHRQKALGYELAKRAYQNGDMAKGDRHSAKAAKLTMPSWLGGKKK